MKRKNKAPTTYQELMNIKETNFGNKAQNTNNKKNKKSTFWLKSILSFLLLVTLTLIAAFINRSGRTTSSQDMGNVSWWGIQSIDTVKYSRDVAAAKLGDTSYDTIIDTQLKLIASTGANYVTIDTPYDAKFVPFLKRWVLTARKYKLKVWFRGNMSGWEGWFGYDKLDRNQHIEGVKNFILSNGDLFQDGDIFTACPECENGGPGDPRRTGDVAGFRKFLIDEYIATNDAFRKIGKNVRSNFIPMNGDVAKLIMDKNTTKDLGGIVVIDHYVATPEKLANDVSDIAQRSGGQVMLGEFGVPIPDINGNMTEDQQAVWLNKALSLLEKDDNLIGLNYWVSFGGSTQLWNNNGSPRKAVGVLTSFYKPQVVKGQILDEVGNPVAGASITLGSRWTSSDTNGWFKIPFISSQQPLTVTSDGYDKREVSNYTSDQDLMISLNLKQENFIFKIEKDIYNLTH